MLQKDHGKLQIGLAQMIANKELYIKSGARNKSTSRSDEEETATDAAYL